MTERTCALCCKTFLQNIGRGRGRPRRYCYDCSPPSAKYQTRTLIHKTCAECGKPFTTKQARTRLCSQKCVADQKRYTSGRICEVCGTRYKASYTAQRTCSRTCGKVIHAGFHKETALIWRTCRWCSESWVANKRPTHCKKPPRTPKPRNTECAWCAGPIAIPAPNKKYCSPACRSICHPQRKKVTHILYGACTQCGDAFVRRAGQRGEFCTRACSRRARKRRGRRRLRGAPQREAYTLRQVAERDGWRCHLCGKRVPDRPYAARPLDPTVDHLIPVSAGGNDTLDNVALAHNRCNWLRSDTGQAQLRLIA